MPYSEITIKILKLEEQKTRLVAALREWLPEDERWDTPKLKRDRALLKELEG